MIVIVNSNCVIVVRVVIITGFIAIVLLVTERKENRRKEGDTSNILSNIKYSCSSYHNRRKEKRAATDI